MRDYDVMDEVQEGRLVERALALVQVPSPSGSEEEVARLYAGILSQAGLAVELDHEFPESPSVIGRIAGSVPGPTLQLAGHLDTVSTPHTPALLAEGQIFGRGACDMKGGLAVMAEVAEILSGLRGQWGGSLLVTAHGQHEEAVNGRPLHAPLLGLLRRGVNGDACLIPEGPHDELPIAGRGLVIFKAHFEREGEPVHEVLSGPPTPPNPNMACHKFISIMEERSLEWVHSNELAGPETFFVGAIAGGDYYNRIPSQACVWGTRRYPPGQTFEAVERELVEVSQQAAAEVGCMARLEVQRSGQPFAISSHDRLVGVLRRCYLQVVGTELPLAGMRYSADASQFINEASVTALYHGTNSARAHSDVEFVDVADLVRCARVLVGTALGYLTQSPQRPLR